MTDDMELPRLLELDDELPDDLRAGLSGLRSRVATPEQLTRMAAVVLPIAGTSVSSASSATSASGTGAAASGTKVALVAGSLIAGAAGIAALVFWLGRTPSHAGASRPVARTNAGAVIDEAKPVAGNPGGSLRVGGGAGSVVAGTAASSTSGADTTSPPAPGDQTAVDPIADRAAGAARGGVAAPAAGEDTRSSTGGGSVALAPGRRATAASAGATTNTGGSTRLGSGSSAADAAASSRPSARQDEGQNFRDARDALRSNPALTLRLADEHRRIYGTRSMGQEFEFYAIEALVRLGNTAAARDRAERFRRDFPNSPYQTRVDSIAGTQ